MMLAVPLALKSVDLSPTVTPSAKRANTRAPAKRCWRRWRGVKRTCRGGNEDTHMLCLLVVSPSDGGSEEKRLLSAIALFNTAQGEGISGGILQR